RRVRQCGRRDHPGARRLPRPAAQRFPRRLRRFCCPRAARLPCWSSSRSPGWPVEAAELADKEGVSVEVLDLRTLCPLDRQAILDSVKKTSKAIVLHEDNKTGGVGAEISALLAEEAFEHLDGPVVRIAGPDVHFSFSHVLEEAYLPSTERILDEVRKLAAY